MLVFAEAASSGSDTRTVVLMAAAGLFGTGAKYVVDKATEWFKASKDVAARQDEAARAKADKEQDAIVLHLNRWIERVERERDDERDEWRKERQSLAERVQSLEHRQRMTDIVMERQSNRISHYEEVLTVNKIQFRPWVDPLATLGLGLGDGSGLHPPFPGTGSRPAPDQPAPPKEGG